MPGITINITYEDLKEFLESGKEKNFEQYVRKNCLYVHSIEGVNLGEIPEYQPIKIVVPEGALERALFGASLDESTSLLNKEKSFECTTHGSCVQFEGGIDKAEFPGITFSKASYEPSNYPVPNPKDKDAVRRHKETIARGIFWASVVTTYSSGKVMETIGNMPVIGKLCELVGNVVVGVSDQAINVQLITKVLGDIRGQTQAKDRANAVTDFLLKGPKELIPSSVIDDYYGTSNGDNFLMIGAAMEHVERPLAVYKAITLLPVALRAFLAVPMGVALAAMTNNALEAAARILDSQTNQDFLAREVPGSKEFNKEMEKVLFFAKFKKSLWIGAGVLAVVSLALFLGPAIPVIGSALIAPIAAAAITPAGAWAVATGIALFSGSVSFFRINIMHGIGRSIRYIGRSFIGIFVRRRSSREPIHSIDKQPIKTIQTKKLSDLRGEEFAEFGCEIIKIIKDKIPAVSGWVYGKYTEQRIVTLRTIVPKYIKSLQESGTFREKSTKEILSVIKSTKFPLLEKYIKENYSKSAKKIEKELREGGGVGANIVNEMVRVTEKPVVKGKSKNHASKEQDKKKEKEERENTLNKNS